MNHEDEEILQDFLLEAGEILEQLSEQLVALERDADNIDLLNSIFRGFHTVKGGAGFLGLKPLVEICHVTENLFDALRKGQCRITGELMDLTLQGLDSINVMYQQLQQREELAAANSGLLARIKRLVEGEQECVAPKKEVETARPAAAVPQKKVAGCANDVVEQALREMLDEAEAPAAQGLSAAERDEITDDEFEMLLDQLHGKGKHGGVPANKTDGVKIDNKAAGSDLINDDEFEAVLDGLHGKGKGPTSEQKTDKTRHNDVVSTPVSALESSSSSGILKKAEPVSAASAKETPAAAAENTVRVDTHRLDDIMNMVGELVLVRNRLVRLGVDSHDEELSKVVTHLDVVTADLQNAVMKTRMQPIKKVFGRFPRVVRDLARSLGKEINLEMIGEETDLDKNLVEALADPLIHMVRNSVDHGIEMPDERVESGKSRAGRIVLSAVQEGDHIILSITDDGRGMDPNKLRAIAVARGVLDKDAAERLSDTECFDLIFAPGFSTKSEISDISGRGVGMDVVKTRIGQLNGSVFITSELGRGTKIDIKVPLTLAIMPTLMVMLGDQAFAFPLANVNEIFMLDLSDTNVVNGQEIILVRNKPLPLFHLGRWLCKNPGETRNVENAHVVIVTVGNQRIGLVVDQLLGQEEVVIKSLGAMLAGTQGVAGATITGDGRIALILDIPGILKKYA
ncbi:MAG TPA: chemotaxis protein CheA [Pseudomonadales bacterium]|nr:chemotaxis protein CheA [Pseudomonadales bacterium]HMW83031.1 chemotaxis protein CheA [Pseudomonadales bacterium]HMZ70019.1 chemotaxis protein CheA [Pseudomonadales bacterium]HMZ91477.1 chemotaxis protein CheA [Pseudomonadales bacterium]HNC76477.1 chemotaxis protein CheA [Pseudomonadales bacterium]